GGLAVFANQGFYLLLTCCILSIYGCIASLLAAKWRHRRLFRSSKYALTITTTLCIIAAGLLWYSLMNHDYAIGYVYRNSSNDLPPWYRVTAFWSALEGSHFLWTLLINIVSCVAIWTYAKDNEHIMPYVAATLQAVMGWMFYLAITHSDPFQMMMPTPPNGQG